MRIHFIQHVHFETPGYLFNWAITQQHHTSFTKIYESVTFPALTDIDMLVIMGGPMGVYEEDKYAWLKEEKAYIKSAIGAGKKVLGICLGSQLIAEVAGAKVYPHTTKEIGWWPVQKAASAGAAATLTADLPANFITFHWHGDTFDLPPGAQLLFSTPVCKHQGFLINTSVAGLQFHFEATSLLVEEMVANGLDELVEAPYIQSGEQMITQNDSHQTTQEQQLLTFINAFVSL